MVQVNNWHCLNKVMEHDRDKAQNRRKVHDDALGSKLASVLQHRTVQKGRHQRKKKA